MNANRIRHWYSIIATAGLVAIAACVWITGGGETRDGMVLIAMTLCAAAWMHAVDRIDAAVRRRAERDLDERRAA
jgi:peptidoglycan/LPS O-acetylase OafA/YrhL